MPKPTANKIIWIFFANKNNDNSNNNSKDKTNNNNNDNNSNSHKDNDTENNNNCSPPQPCSSLLGMFITIASVKEGN